MESTDIQLTAKQQQWLSHLEAADEQNLSLAAYAKQECLDLKRLYSWKSQLKQKGLFSAETDNSFIKAQVSTSVSLSHTTGIHVVLPNGIRLELPYNATSLSGLIRELATL